MTDILPISFLIGVLLIFLDKISVSFGISNLRKTPQTLHKKSISRFGGVGIFASLLIVTFLDNTSEYNYLQTLLFCSLPVFILGIIDDLQISIRPILRLLIVFPSAYLMYFYLGIEAYSLDIPILDDLFTFKWFSVLFICFALSGMVNAFNMIDGINGLVLLFCMSICVSVLIFPEIYNNYSNVLFFVALFFSILGIFILNFPFGRIFLGDGGAYFLGMAISVSLIKFYQDNELSPWYVLLMLIYPLTDVIASIIRRIAAKLSFLDPDDKHLHHLIYRRVSKMGIKSENMKHALVTFLIFILYFPFLLAANLFAKETFTLQVLSLIFILFYFGLYIISIPKDFASEDQP
tara:strand:- start:488 stop:1534 length:1047 start_codon:yes stop_codon:yes gene_type:complete